MLLSNRRGLFWQYFHFDAISKNDGGSQTGIVNRDVFRRTVGIVIGRFIGLPLVLPTGKIDAFARYRREEVRPKKLILLTVMNHIGFFHHLKLKRSFENNV